MKETNESVQNMKLGLIGWYPFKKESRILYVGRSGDTVFKKLIEAGHIVNACGLSAVRKPYHADAGSSKSDHRTYGEYDYIICISSLEKEREPKETLAILGRFLKKDGILLLGMNNRYGLRFLCGDTDPYTEHVFDGPENYSRAYAKTEDSFFGRCYSKSEIEETLIQSGFTKNRFYSVLPTLEAAHFLFAEDFVPNEDLSNRVFPEYNSPSTVFLDEERLYNDLIREGMFHHTANAYLIECSACGGLSDTYSVTSSTDRGKERSVYTIIKRNGTVIKKAVFAEGRSRLSQIIEYNKDLISHGVNVIDTKVNDAEGFLTMPFINAPTGQQYLKELLKKDKKQFLCALDLFRDQIMKSSDIVRTYKRSGRGVVLKHGYSDMVPLNSFYINGQFVFFDQEFRIDNCNANMIITRMIATLYSGDPEMTRLMDISKLYDRYGLTDQRDRWLGEEWKFLSKIRNEKRLSVYHQKVRRDPDIENSNRQRMNYSEEDYRKLFVDIFDKADTRKLILFGSGAFARKFLDVYGNDYKICAVIDNNSKRWGDKIGDITISAPEILKGMSPGEYKIMICIKNYISVMHQLDDMGAGGSYSIYEPGTCYPRAKKTAVSDITLSHNDACINKKYHIGYISGTFDLFHVGHLNLLRKAKEQCDHLIVGVVSDEGVKKFKKTTPFIPFTERIEIVRACRYVDEAVEIPFESRGIEDAYRKYKFDCQFCGSDYVKDKAFAQGKKWLEARGSELVILPYTRSTSSTKIKASIDKEIQPD